VQHREPFAAPIKGGARSVAFAPGGRMLGSAGTGEAVRLWNIDVNYWLERTCALANRDLTEVERSQFMGAETPYTPTCGAAPPEPDLATRLGSSVQSISAGPLSR
jgi:hypothetical protein